MAQEEASSAVSRKMRSQSSPARSGDAVALERKVLPTERSATTTTTTPALALALRRVPFETRPNAAAAAAAQQHHRKRRKDPRLRLRFAVLCRLAAATIFLSVYRTIYHRLAEIEAGYDPRSEEHPRDDHQQRQNRPIGVDDSGVVVAAENPVASEAASSSSRRSTPTGRRGEGNTTTMAHYLHIEASRDVDASDNDAPPASNPHHPGLEEARAGRERIVSILEDAGIEDFDAEDVLRLPLWTSVLDLYYRDARRASGVDGIDAGDGGGGPIVLGLDGCEGFRARVPPSDRYLGVAGNFNSGTTAFGISLQKNCRFPEHPASKSFVERKGRGGGAVFASDVNGMLSQVPWLKHKTAEHRDRRDTVLPPSLASIDRDDVLPIVLVRDPFYWMQSMCKEGYGVRWDHDSKRHCPNLIPDETDRGRFPGVAARRNASIPVWMGASPAEGVTWPSLIHYWNAWYGSYYYYREDDTPEDRGGGAGSSDRAEKGRGSSTWPRLMIRFEDTLFYPRQVMETVCHCGGGRLRFEGSSEPDEPNDDGGANRPPGDDRPTTAAGHDYTIEEAKPLHRHERKSNFVTAIIRYGTNATRFRNMTEEDVRFAVESLDPTLMKAFGYSYPDDDTDATLRRKLRY